MALSCFHPFLWINRCDRMGKATKSAPPFLRGGKSFLHIQSEGPLLCAWEAFNAATWLRVKVMTHVWLSV